MQEYIVSAKCGKVRGYARGGFAEFRGIPYASPPVGELRFKRAVSHRPWDDILDAKNFGPPSVQLDTGILSGSEDCLTLNITVPEGAKGAPVLVWIHGGSFATGSAQDPLACGDAYARAGIVFVAIQYRLNVFGFYDFTTYPGCEDFESNCGLSDQIMALKWVHENIEAFGGDPGRVTIMGESAGAASVIDLMIAPGAKGLFSQAIAESSLPDCVMTHEMARKNMDLYIEGMGWRRAELGKNLRSVDPYEAQRGNKYIYEQHQRRNPGIFLPCPVIDDILPERPLDALERGAAKGIKLLIGTNRDEGTMFVRKDNPAFPADWDMAGRMFESNGSSDRLEAVREHYGAFGDDSFTEFVTDYVFLVPSVKAAIAQKEHADVWMYSYEFVTKAGEENGTRASHAYELPCVFGVRDCDFARYILGDEPQDVFEKLSYEMQSRWIRFIKEGDPDPEGWPRFEGARSPVFVFDRKSGAKVIDRSEILKLWGDMRFYA